MPKKALCLLTLLLFYRLAYAQRFTANQAIVNTYHTASDTLTNLKDSVKYYLIQFKNPQAYRQRNFRLIKRITYNYYIVAASKKVVTDNNIISISNADASWKASDNLLLQLQKHPKSTKSIELNVSVVSDSLVKTITHFGKIISRSPNKIVINTSLQYLPKLLQLREVLFANEKRLAHEDLAISDIDLAANNISAIPNQYPGINGTGIKVAIKEDRYDDDLDLLGRSFNSFKPAAFTSGHATIMATLIGGNGNSYIKGLGIAPKVKFTSSDFADLMPDSTAVFKAYDIGLQNHSYGTGIENYYGTEAVAYDKQVFETDSIIHVFSSGNIGTTIPETGLYNGINGVANLSGTFKQAKNVMVVGGTGRTNLPEDLSSAGPAYDGRIKPELVADGEDGTSGAAALVTGTVALLQQAYKQTTHHLPSAALIKAVLINSADDVGRPGIDFKTGYGKLNALEAMRTISENRFMSDIVSNGQQRDFTIDVPANSAMLKVSLVWNDPAAELNAPSALINNLDLTVTTPGGQIILPWTLSAYPSADSLSRAAQRGKDSLNNTEQVTLQNPEPGAYMIQVKGTTVTVATQNFCLAYQAIPANGFEWTYPSGNEQFFASDDSYLRWQSSAGAVSGQLSVSYDGGLTWNALDNVTLQNKYYVWTTPELFTQAMLKMEINGKAYISKPFSISRPPIIQVGYNCTDGTLLHWSAQPGSTGYVVYTIKDYQLTRLTTATDTSIVVPAQLQSSTYYAVSAQGSGFEGIKSYTIDATTQGVGCYVKTLLANMANNDVLINLNLGSVVNLSSVVWEKITANNQFVAFGTSKISSSLNYQFTDPNPRKGIQYYRAKLVTQDGKTIFSDTARVNYLQPNQFVVYPNPVSSLLNVLSGDLNNYQFKLYDTTGRLSMNAELNELKSTIQLSVIPGIYVYVILLNGKIVDQGKLIKI